MPYRIVTLVYAVREGKVLLLRRRRPPYAGYWVAPGGKVERGESPRAGAIRELAEETGLEADDVELRAIVTESSTREDWQWLIFVYRAIDPGGRLASDEREGELAWFDPAVDPADGKIPPADRVFMPIVLGEQSGVTELFFEYSQDLEIVSSSVTSPPL